MISESSPLLLGSGSPRRRAFLRDLGVAVVTRPPDVDEALREGEGPMPYLERVVADKQAATRSLLQSEAGLLVADTIVVRAGAIFGKPTGAEDAARMLRAMRGQTHQVFTRFALEDRAGRSVVLTVGTDVEVAPFDDGFLTAYLATGEGIDKAGGYAIQGLFASAITAIRGSYTNVVGLPMAEVREALGALDLAPHGGFLSAVRAGGA